MTEGRTIYLRLDKDCNIIETSSKPISLNISSSPSTTLDSSAGYTTISAFGGKSEDYKKLQRDVYCWLGYTRDKIPAAAVSQLQDILGELKL